MTNLASDLPTAEAVGKSLARFVTTPAYLLQAYQNAVGDVVYVRPINKSLNGSAIVNALTTGYRAWRNLIRFTTLDIVSVSQFGQVAVSRLGL